MGVLESLFIALFCFWVEQNKSKLNNFVCYQPSKCYVLKQAIASAFAKSKYWGCRPWSAFNYNRCYVAFSSKPDRYWGSNKMKRNIIRTAIKKKQALKSERVRDSSRYKTVRRSCFGKENRAVLFIWVHEMSSALRILQKSSGVLRCSLASRAIVAGKTR